MRERARTPAADDQMSLDIELAQALDQADAIHSARGSGDTDNDPHLVNSQFPTPKTQPLPTTNSQPPTTLNVPIGSWDLGLGSGWELGIGSWELKMKGYHRGSCSRERPRDRCCAPRAASSSASTMRPATTADAAIPVCG